MRFESVIRGDDDVICVDGPAVSGSCNEDAPCPQCGEPAPAEVRAEDYLTFLAASA